MVYNYCQLKKKKIINYGIVDENESQQKIIRGSVFKP